MVQSSRLSPTNPDRRGSGYDAELKTCSNKSGLSWIRVWCRVHDLLQQIRFVVDQGMAQSSRLFQTNPDCRGSGYGAELTAFSNKSGLSWVWVWRRAEDLLQQNRIVVDQGMTKSSRLVPTNPDCLGSGYGAKFTTCSNKSGL
ncbi:hypothetical protein ElyMa_001328200 [Elysia marginata]|uniref:Uncharacterized protein n=1 Tax=Elysia marginata TaxID=1093978 RepID=A0AAV4ILE1_9GAST|nr:hypothetical protein ElyMa_001328200 [Elysia marginata]